jgi:hypothetical protein
MTWIYNGNEINNINDFPPNAFGFCYRITNLKTQQFYIGKKFIQHKTTKKLGKKAISQQLGPGRKKIKETIIKESNWINYWSSSKVLQLQVQELGEENFIKEIIDFGFSSKHLSYLEAKYQFIFSVLENSNSLNDNIQGKFYRKDLAF